MVDIFKDTNWSLVNGGSDLIRSFLPNRLWYNESERAAAIVVERSLRSGDFGLGSGAVNYVKAAVEKGSITTALLVLVERGTRTVVNSAPLSEVKLDEPITGFKGNYWWVSDADLKDARLCKGNDIPF